jgi:hypothetical protein
MPAEVLAGRDKVQLLGYGELKAGETRDGQVAFAVPEEAQGKFQANYAWVFKLERQP